MTIEFKDNCPKGCYYGSFWYNYDQELECTECGTMAKHVDANEALEEIGPLRIEIEELRSKYNSTVASHVRYTEQIDRQMADLMKKVDNND